MELTPYLFWNIFITLVLAPVLFSIKQNTQEAKRIDILLNKTREELAKEYVTKTELKGLMFDDFLWISGVSCVFLFSQASKCTWCEASSSSDF